MLSRMTVLAATLALCLSLVACGGSGDEEAPAEVVTTPAPAQAATAAPAESATVQASSDESVDLVEHLRAKTFHLWGVYNTHEPDALEIFYSDDYWREEKDLIRSNMQPFKNQGLLFTSEETSAPTEISPGKWETKHTARFPGGLVKMVFIYEEFNGEWLLTFAKPR